MATPTATPTATTGNRTGLGLLPLGVGDAFSARHYSFCLAVEAEATGEWLLVDCPHPIRKIMREASLTAGIDPPLDVHRVRAVALSHLHADHASGLEGFGYFAHFALGRRARVLAHRAVAARLWGGHLAAGMEQLMSAADRSVRVRTFDDFFEWVPLDETRAVVEGPFTIECRRTIHHIPTTAFRIRAGGRCLGISSDTAFDPSLIEWLTEADLIVHETNLGVHTPYADLAALPEPLRAKMRLVHYMDGFDEVPRAIALLHQGERVAV